MVEGHLMTPDIAVFIALHRDIVEMAQILFNIIWSTELIAAHAILTVPYGTIVIVMLCTLVDFFKFIHNLGLT